METYCMICLKYTALKNSSLRKTSENRLILLLQCTICGKKKSTFSKNKKHHNVYNKFKMIKIINKRLLTWYEFMLELHLKQPRWFTYSACGPFTKHRERIWKLRETGNLKLWPVSCRRQGMLTQGPALDSKCNLNISSILTLPHFSDCLICARKSVSSY